MKAREESSRNRPGIVVLSLWLTVAALSLYGVNVVRDEVDQTESLQEDPRLQALFDDVAEFVEIARLDELKNALASVREAVNEPRRVLADRASNDPDSDADEPSFEPLDPQGGQAVLTRARRPRRVLVIGASSIQFAIGVEFERRLGQYADLRVKRYGQLATGLTRPDFMSWPKKLEELSASFPPDLIIINFGGNDAQPITTETEGKKRVKYNFWTDDWDRVYASRIDEIIDIAERHGADTVWLGMPVMRSSAFSKKMRRLNEVMKRAVERRDELFISTYGMASTREGAYRKTIVFEKKRGLMRTSDGVHYTRLGARFVVEHVLRIVERHFRLDPGAPDLAVAKPYALESKILARPISVVTYHPRKTSDVTATPMTLLLPEHGAAWQGWAEHPHRNLQALAQKYGITVAVPQLGADGWYVDGPESAARFLSVLESELVPALQSLEEVGPRLGVAGVRSGGHGALLVAVRRNVPVDVVSVADAPLLPQTLRRSATVLGRLGDRGPNALEEVSPLRVLERVRMPGLSVRVLAPPAARHETDMATLESTFAESQNLRSTPVPSAQLTGVLEVLLKEQAEALAPPSPRPAPAHGPSPNGDGAEAPAP